MFVSGEPVAVTLPDNPNAILIRPKMDLATENRVVGALAQMEQSTGQARLDVGAYLLELAVANIVGWQGPAFEGVACTPEAIRRLDPDDPLVDAALDEIGRRNPARKPGKN